METNLTIRIARRDARPHCTGQALIEFVIALVAIIVIFAGLLQIGLLGSAQSASMMEARRLAGAEAMKDDPASPTPPFLRDRAEGADGSLYSADDVDVPANASDLSVQILSHGHPVELDDTLDGNVLSRMVRNPEPQFEFGLLRGYDTRDVPLFPAITHLVYPKEEVTLKSEVWIPWTKGIY